MDLLRRAKAALLKGQAGSMLYHVDALSLISIL
jgi:hypothetical protein